ncbi:MscL family protein [Candidatus Peregrinibacteria bacterium]|nr:MscL family protein [Candidatus Peregrinibacteria bacterium]
MKKHLKGFSDFIREQGVVGLAVGFILGGSVAKVVSSVVNDLINPMIGLVLGATSGLKEAYFEIGTAKIMWGNFVSVFIDFMVVALVVYFGVKLLKLDKLDKKKEDAKDKKKTKK